MIDHRCEHSGRILRWLERLIFLALMMQATAVRAEVFKCADGRGDVAYQDRPCAALASQSVVAIAPAPAYTPSPAYAVDPAADVKEAKAKHHESRARALVSDEPGSYECRTADGQVFFRHTACPHTVAAASGAVKKGGAAKTVSVSSIRIARDEACTQMRRAGAIGRSGHRLDQDVSTYDKNLGRDPCS